MKEHTVDIKLQHILIQLGVQPHRSVQDPLSHVLQPIDMALFEISQAPEISSLHQHEQVQACESFLIPIEVRSQ